MDYEYYDQLYGSVTKKKGSIWAKILPIAIAVILLIIAVAVVLIAGRLLGQMNKSSCRNDEHVANARQLCTWIVIIAAILAGLLLLGIVSVIVFMVARSTKK